MAKSLTELGALTGASDHGVSKSLYGRDPDGNEFEVMWQVPQEAWGQFADEATIMPLDLEAELRRWGNRRDQSSRRSQRAGASRAGRRAPRDGSTMNRSMIFWTVISPRVGWAPRRVHASGGKDRRHR